VQSVYVILEDWKWEEMCDSVTAVFNILTFSLADVEFFRLY